jgi:hypothetical protein
VAAPAPARACEGCGGELAPALLACPSCLRLVHGARLTALAREARAAVERGLLSQGAAQWRSALELLPAESTQHAQVQERIAALSERIEREGGGSARPPGDRRLGRSIGAVGALGVLAWKFKALALLVLGKAKLLLFGLTKASTLLSMAASLGVYWSVLDGGRGFASFTRGQRWLAVALLAGLWAATQEGLLLLLCLGGAGRALVGIPAGAADWPAFALYAFLAAVLGVATLIPVAIV